MSLQGNGPVTVSLQDSALDPALGYARIRDVAESLGLTLRAIRFYESKGLIAPARDDTNRFFSARDIEQLRLIRKLKLFGLSLLEIKSVLTHPADGPYGLTSELCEDLIERLTEQRVRVAAAISELEQIAAKSVLEGKVLSANDGP
jgi:DNA-binding transcriptional MerR regulator